MSLRGHHDWAMRRPSFLSANYATNADTEQQIPQITSTPDENEGTRYKKTFSLKSKIEKF
jgi:hypothetical protein